MYKKFNEFKEQKNQERLYRQFDAICEAAHSSGKSFNEFWESNVIPVFLDHHFDSPEQATELLLENIGSALGGMAGRIGGSIARNAVDFGSNAFKGAKQGWGAGTQQNPHQAQPQNQVAGPQFIQQHVTPLKTDFVNGMKSVQKLMQRKHGNDPTGYKGQVMQQLMTSAEQWANNWAPNMNNMQQAQAQQAQQAQQMPQTQVGGQTAPQSQLSPSNQS